ELCRPVLRPDSRLYHLGLDVVSFQVEPRDPRVFGRRLHRYHRRAAVAVREPQTSETDVRAEIDEPSGRQLEGQSVTLVHPHLPDRLHIPAVQAIVELDASAYADPALAVAARKRHQSGQAQKEDVCGKPCERSRVRGQRKTAAQLTPDLLDDLLHSRHDCIEAAAHKDEADNSKKIAERDGRIELNHVMDYYMRSLCSRPE